MSVLSSVTLVSGIRQHTSRRIPLISWPRIPAVKASDVARLSAECVLAVRALVLAIWTTVRNPTLLDLRQILHLDHNDDANAIVLLKFAAADAATRTLPETS